MDLPLHTITYYTRLQKLVKTKQNNKNYDIVQQNNTLIPK